MKLFKKITAFAATLALALGAFAQGVGTGTGGSKYTWVPVPLPVSYLAGSVATNLAGGWTNQTTSTNVLVLYTNAAGGGTAGFVNVTNITTNTTIQFAQFSSQGQRNVGIQIDLQANGASTDVDTIWIERSVTGVNFDTVFPQIIGLAANGATLQTLTTNLDMFGFGFARITIISNAATGARFFTNNIYVSQITGQGR